MIVAVLRSIVISSISLLVLPMVLGLNGVWLAMPLSELIVAVIALVYIKMERKRKLWQRENGLSS